MRRLSFLVVACCFVCLDSAWAAQAALDGVLRDAAGVPMPNIDIQLEDGAGKTVDATKTNAEGHYALSAVADNVYILFAISNGAVLGSVPVSMVEGKDTHKDINLADTQNVNIIIARRQQARNDLSPKTGSNAYALNQQAINDLPLGGNTSFNKVLLQAPGVAEDSAASGNLHIRGEHANLQYRLNGILLPDGISGFGDTIDSSIIEKATLLDGVLPAQYGFHTAGVIDIDTKTGFQNGGTASMMGGSYGTIQPSFSYGNTVGATDYFVAASHLSSDLGIENPVKSVDAIHDHTEQDRQFGYASYMINPMQRVSLITGNSISYFQIPNNPNQTTIYQLNGSSAFNSVSLNERQFESNQFMTAAWQGGRDGVTMQIAPYIRNSELHFRPDVTGDLLFNGLASDVNDKDLVTGLQNDNSWKINAAHTLRTGFTVQNDHVQADSNSLAFQTDANGTPLTDGNGNNILTPHIIENHASDSQLYGLYLQDEWKITDTLTMNYGARFDDMEADVSANQLSPRIGLVYKATDTTTLHAGYARTFTPPPQELVANEDISQFANTTNAAQVTLNDPVKPERTHSFDAGVTQKIGNHWEVGLDGYYKLAHDLLDEGQFGQALILTPFNYEHGYIYGSELTATYTGDRLKAYANFAASRAMGENVVSAEFKFTDPTEFDYIKNHFVHLDHDQTYTASAGMTYDVSRDTTVGLDGREGSGLRSGFANLSHLPAYATLDTSVEQRLNLFPHDQTAVKLSVINLFDTPYELRSGTGIGVGAPQWGARRGVFATLTQKF